jgi:hypothetical protein
MKMNASRLALSLSSLSLLTVACGDDDVTPPDARVDTQVVDMPVDMATYEVNFMSNEGGEVRWEYLDFNPGFIPGTATLGYDVDRARATAFFYKGPTGNSSAGVKPLPAIPGCTHYAKLPPAMNDQHMNWPMYQDPTRQYLDVGQVIITGGPTQMILGTGATNGVDALDRMHTTWDFSNITGNDGMMGRNAPNIGRTYISDNTVYDVILTGSSEWPAQIFNDVLYMPDYFTLIDPPATPAGCDVNTPAPCAVALPARDTPLTITFTPGTNTNKPAGMEIDTLVAFVNGNPPVAICVEEGTDGSITIPGATINHVRDTGVSGSRILRQNVVHVLRELTNGTTHDNKRIDFISVWCYNYQYTFN